MKDERNVRRRRAAGRKWQPVAILLAAVLMVLSVPFGLKSARAAEHKFIDLTTPCSLTISLTGDVTMAEDAKTANAVIDLYRIADAAEVKGFDTYTFKASPGFEALEAAMTDKDIDAAGWKAIAQQAAGIILGSAPEGKTEWDPSATAAAYDSLKTTGDPETKIENLDAGLYLVIAHGKDVTEYATTVTDDTGTSGIATIANSKTYAYKFAPELISLPTKDAENDIINTANTGDWIYDATAAMKPTREFRIGDLEITKILEDYRQRAKETGENPRLIKDPATFVFEVTAYEDDTQKVEVYHDYVSIVFDAFGTKSVLVKDLPVGSYVVVKEEYHGNYTAYPDQTTTIIANETVGVTFKNTYDDGEPGGGSVTNHFEYSEDGGWVQKEQTDNTEDGSKVSEEKTTGNQ